MPKFTIYMGTACGCCDRSSSSSGGGDPVGCCNITTTSIILLTVSSGECGGDGLNFANAPLAYNRMQGSNPIFSGLSPCGDLWEAMCIPQSPGQPPRWQIWPLSGVNQTDSFAASSCDPLAVSGTGAAPSGAGNQTCNCPTGGAYSWSITG